MVYEEVVAHLAKYCNNGGHAPLSLLRYVNEHAEELSLSPEELKWLKDRYHRIREIVKSEPGRRTIYAFRNDETHTSYSLQMLFKAKTHSSYRDWLEKLTTIGLLQRYDQDDNLDGWSKKKIYALNPQYREITKIIVAVIKERQDFI